MRAGMELGPRSSTSRFGPINMDDAVATVEQWIAARTPNYVCITGVHGVIESRSDDRLLAIHNRAGLVTPDGMPLVWMSRALGYRRASRVYGPDLMRTLSAVSARKGYRQFYYGGNEGVADLLKKTLEERYPGLQVVGTHTPPFRALTADEDEAVVRKINEARPDIVWVGLSTPKQEYWMADHVNRIDVPVMIGIGAAFDFLSGLKPQAPPSCSATVSNGCIAWPPSRAVYGGAISTSFRNFSCLAARNS